VESVWFESRPGTYPPNHVDIPNKIGMCIINSSIHPLQFRNIYPVFIIINAEILLELHLEVGVFGFAPPVKCHT